MRKLHNRKGGFTLIELMIVVAIIGILAAIAIPNFLMFQLRSKTGEAKVNLAAIRTAEEGFFAEFGAYVPAAANPGAPTSQKAPWGTPVDFGSMGWAPEGDVYFQYDASVAGSSYSLSAVGNLDGAGANSEYGYIHPDAAGALALIGGSVSCAAGVFNGDPIAPASDLLNTVGGCTLNVCVVTMFPGRPQSSS